jgi:hypothetical protein
LYFLGGKIGGIWLAGPILVESPSLEIWGSEPSKSNLRHQTTLSGGQKFLFIDLIPSMMFYTLRGFQWFIDPILTS